MAFFSKSFLPYPHIERQDLTQGQLGSFKFTPVDAVQRDHNRDFFTAMAHQEMLTQLQNAAQQAVAMAPPDGYPHARSNSAGCFSNTWSSHGNPQSPKQDIAFFDKHSKPDLADSRLKYGPAALRSAVESHSPVRLKTGIQPVIPQYPTSNADMNPVASTFVPSGLPNRHDSDEAITTLHALARSLASEQNAHHATQMALEEALNKVTELEDGVKKIEKQNKSLVSAVNMLGGIIKHNQHKLRKRDQTPTEPDISSEAVNAELNEPVNQVSPIVYDVLAKQLAEKGRSSTETEATSVADSVQVNPIRPADDTDLFNLELLKRPVHEDSAGSALGDTLRRHFFESSDEDNTARLSRAVSPVQSADKLISLSPDIDPDTQYTPLLAVSQRLQTVNMSATPTKSKVTELANKPVLQLPQSFLAKYKTPAKDRKVPGVPIEDETSKATTQIATTTSAPALAPNSFESSVTSPTRRRIAKLPQTFDLTIKWNVNRENPIWDDDYEKMLALGRENLPFNLQNSFWKHPVRYIEYADKNLFRTVMIDYIPMGATYKDVLNEISGGSLEQIELVDPIGSATDYMTARIIFNYELSASTTANHARDHGMKIKGQPLRVWQVLTQTWPKSKKLEEDVFVNCYTRILLISQVDPEQLATIPEKLGFLRSSIVEFGLSYDGMPLVEFTSVAAAVKALNVLVNDPELGSTEFDFEEDPCAEPYRAIA